MVGTRDEKFTLVLFLSLLLRWIVSVGVAELVLLSFYLVSVSLYAILLDRAFKSISSQFHRKDLRSYYFNSYRPD